MRRAASILSTALITAGVVILSDVAMTLAWKEPVSSIYGSIKQGQAADELRALEDSFPTEEDLAAIEEIEGLEEKVAYLADRFSEQVTAGEGIGRIIVPAIDIDFVMVEGTDSASLQKGPGRYTQTSFPGQGKTIGIAGHRTTYLAPFNDVDDIGKGDEVVLQMPYAEFTYEVQKSEVVEPSEVGILDDAGYERVVLTACHPKYSAAQRYAVFAKLDTISLFATGGRRWPDP